MLLTTSVSHKDLDIPALQKSQLPTGLSCIIYLS